MIIHQSSVNKKLYDDICSIITIGDAVEAHYKFEQIDGRRHNTAPVNDYKIRGCNKYFKHSLMNWYPSKLNLTKIRMS